MIPVSRALIRPSLLVLCAAAPGWAAAQEDLPLSYGGEDFVTIATGSEQPISRAPAVATVITEDDIDALDARDLDEVLETVPGLHVARSAIGYNSIYTIRGIYSEFNPRVLVLINSIPVTHIFFGNRGQAWAGMPVENIQRIEVVRGPGSALYGADAYAGVINIITKSPEDIDGAEVGARAGSFDTTDAWAIGDLDFGELQAAYSLQVQSTDGHSRTVAADAQTGFDQLFGSDASLAPGPVHTGRDGVDARLELSWPRWRLRLGYQGRRNIESGAGVSGALDPVGESESDRFNADLTYKNQDLWRDWDLEAQLSYFDVSRQSKLFLFPPGATFPAEDGMSLNTFPDGVIGTPDTFERHGRLSVTGLYDGLADHRLRLEVGGAVQDVYKIEETKNFDLTSAGFPTPLPGGLQDVSDSPLVFAEEEGRSIKYLVVQDEWSFARDWTLTGGVRYDDYSDFGGTVNPRAALVWETGYNLTTKFLYGRAFRAPSIAEQFSINNPVGVGNPDLEPETIDTAELAFDYQYSADVRTGLNLFYYEMDDIIRFASVPGQQARQAQNTGRQTGHGLEWVIDWRLSPRWGLKGNYAYQRATDEQSDEDAGNAPNHQLFARLDWRPLPDWQTHLTANWVGDRERVAGDPRSPLEGYVWVDLAVRWGSEDDGFSVSASVRNALDDDAREPSLNPAQPGVPVLIGIPGDLPLPGRHYYFTARYSF